MPSENFYDLPPLTPERATSGRGTSAPTSSADSAAEAARLQVRYPSLAPQGRPAQPTRPSSRAAGPDSEEARLRSRYTSVQRAQPARTPPRSDAAPPPEPVDPALAKRYPSLDADADAPNTEPASLALEAPEGFDAKSAGWHEFTAAATELRLDAKGAERLLALHQAEQARALEAQQQAWEAAAQADREIGGERLDAALADAREALERHGTAELREVLEESGLGSHAEFIRFFARVARATRRG